MIVLSEENQNYLTSQAFLTFFSKKSDIWEELKEVAMKTIVLFISIFFLISMTTLIWKFSETLESSHSSTLLEALEYRPEMERWKYLVLHHSAGASGNASIFHQEHLKRGWEGLGYHFVIGNGNGSEDGEIEIGFRWTEQKHGAHAGNTEYNQQGIGICVVGNLEETFLTEKQLEALIFLIQKIRRVCKIPIENIVGHQDVKASTLCPGKNFPLEYLKKSL